MYVHAGPTPRKGDGCAKKKISWAGSARADRLLHRSGDYSKLKYSLLRGQTGPAPSIEKRREARRSRRRNGKDQMTTYVAVGTAILLGVWVLESVFFVLSYRTNARAEGSRPARPYP